MILTMLVTKLYTFLQKSHQLWSAGHSAHLNLETHAWSAWDGLRLQLGHAPVQPVNEIGINEKNVEETETNENDISECSDHFDLMLKQLVILLLKCKRNIYS